MEKYVKIVDPNLDTVISKYDGPKFDVHVHIDNSKDTEKLIRVAEAFNIRKSLGIIWEDEKDQISESFPDRFIFAKFFSFRGLITGKSKEILEELDTIYARGYPVVKFWFAPRWRDYVEREFKIKVNNLGLDDPLFEPLFSHMEDLGLSALIHVSDPDLWYESKYQPTSKYGTKEDHLQELETVIARHPKLKILGAHFGAQSEHLSNLGRWFDKYPNFYVDTSSARWMAREFAKQKDLVIRFFTKYADRILFGTDTVSSRSSKNNQYLPSRYLTYQVLWETSEIYPLPFPDPENNNGTQIIGLDLPLNILKKLYWENAQSFFSLS
ncbi:MAG: amidohydrolase family protein [Promethearchaeota archaeon]